MCARATVRRVAFTKRKSSTGEGAHEAKSEEMKRDLGEDDGEA